MSVSHGSSQSLTLWCEKPQDCDRKTGNVPAGMIVDGTVTQPNILNFYLVSQQVSVVDVLDYSSITFSVTPGLQDRPTTCVCTMITTPIRAYELRSCSR